MKHYGKVQPGRTIYHYFDTFDGGTGASITMTGLAVTDIEIYKDGSVTQRASDTGYTLLDTDGIDFDGVTGAHGFSIDLSSNATANFYEAGSHYAVLVTSITVDAQAVSFWACDFWIGYEGAVLDTTIATLSSQTSFTLEDGSADNSAYVGCPVIVHDLASGIQVAFGVISAYTGSTKTVTLAADPAIFTMAAGDHISLFPPANTRWAGGVVWGSGAITAASIASNAIAATKIATDAITAAKIAANAIGASELATDAVNEIRDAILSDSTAFAGADIAAILLDTAEIGAAGAGLTEAGGTGDQLTAVPWNTAWDAEVQSEATDALNAYDPPTRAELTSDISGLNDPTAAAIADAVWDEAKAGHVGAGSFGEEVQAHALTSEVSALNDLSAAQVNAEVDTALADYDPPTRAELTSDIASLNDPTAAAIADAVLDEALSGHTTAGTLGKAVADIETDATAILADSNELQGDWANGGRLDLLLDQVITDIAALNDVSTADINAQVLDVLNTDTFAEPTGVPGATVTLATKIGYLYMALRNQITITASKKTFYDDSGSAEWEKDLSDDGTTYTETESNAI